MQADSSSTEAISEAPNKNIVYSLSEISTNQKPYPKEPKDVITSEHLEKIQCETC